MDKKKIIVIISLAVIILASIITNIYILSNSKQEESKIDGIIETKNKEILKDTKVNNLDITNISLLNNDGTSIYRAKISNNTNEDIKLNKLYIIFVENGKETKMLGLSTSKIKSKESSYINISSLEDLTKSTSIKYVIE